MSPTPADTGDELDHQRSTVAEPPSVHAAVAAVIGDLPGIGKDAEMTEGPAYAYRSIEAIKAAVKPLLARHGLHYAPHRILAADDDTVPVGTRGATWQRTRELVRWRIYGPTGDHFDAETRGEGVDSSDKAANKAMTGAEKQLLLTVFAVADGTDDPDHHRPDVTGPGAPSSSTRAGLLARVHELRDALTNRERDEVRAWLEQAGYSPTPSRLRVAELGELVDHLETVFATRQDDHDESEAP